MPGLIQAYVQFDGSFGGHFFVDAIGAAAVHADDHIELIAGGDKLFEVARIGCRHGAFGAAGFAGELAHLYILSGRCGSVFTEKYVTEIEIVEV